MVQVLIQSAQGHDELDVTQAELPGVVGEQLKKDMWVTTEKADGSTEILTKTDLDKLEEDEDPDKYDEDDEELSEEDKAIQSKSDGWASTLTGVKTTPPAKKFESRFENVVSATATAKVKGG